MLPAPTSKWKPRPWGDDVRRIIRSHSPATLRAIAGVLDRQSAALRAAAALPRAKRSALRLN
jgi:hypothetical protein